MEKISDNNINNNPPNIFHPMSLCIRISFAGPMSIATGHKLRTTDLTFTMSILSLDPVLTNISFFTHVLVWAREPYVVSYKW